MFTYMLQIQLFYLFIYLFFLKRGIYFCPLSSFKVGDKCHLLRLRGTLKYDFNGEGTSP